VYRADYYDGFHKGSLRSARVIVPWILDCVSPSSVIDLGCGLCDWLSVFEDIGIGDVLGVDGSHVQADHLAIDPGRFATHDLTRPYCGHRRFDLAMCLEVGEHLPDECAAGLVQSLTELAPVALFSAAIPSQRGLHHVNCQWPEYWARLFRARGFVALDCVRQSLWTDSRIDWWYRQNLILYVAEQELSRFPRLAAFPPTETLLPLVHPEMLQSLERDLTEWGSDWERKYWNLWAEQPAVSRSARV
jgi:hypothetical protein